jgi:hypothetical protein
MLFASDLDQTLIFSPKAFRMLSNVSAPAVSLVEMYDDGRAISFMADPAIRQLEQWASRRFFVPVTTRAIEQYQRISLFREKIIPDYSVVSNGGNVIVKGAVDQDWQNKIKANISQLCLCDQDVVRQFSEISHISWSGPLKMADSCFHYCIVERDKIPMDDLTSFALWAKAQNWSISLQGRKLYIVPQVVNKWDAVVYIRDLLNAKVVIAAGDSLLDLCMLEQADYAIAPRHGEIWHSYCAGTLAVSKIQFTKQAGILAAQEILDYLDTFAIYGMQA